MGARGRAGVTVALAMVAFAADGQDFRSARPNTWVKVHESPTGGRSAPIFFYEPGFKKFVLAGGVPGGGKRHFDTEMFDLETAKWINAYPDGAPYTAETGETDAPATTEEQAKGNALVTDPRGVTRLAMFGSAYGTDTRAHFQWTFDPDGRKLIAYLRNHTVVYDPAARSWRDTGAPPFSKGRFPMVWGNLCYDPLNKEVVSIGGASEEKGGTPGTWVYRPAGNVWARVPAGSEELNALHRKAEGLRRQAWALVSACRSRFFVTETEKEAKASLSERASTLRGAAEKLLRELGGAGLSGTEVEAARRATARLRESVDLLRTGAGTFDAAMSPEGIAGAKKVFESIEAAEAALAPEPPGRAHSQPAFDAGSGKMVLFGGSGLDRCTADTWVYECKTRRWERRYPRVSPSPRAGHALVALPKSGKIALIGGYSIRGSFVEIPHQVWVYDVAANEWKLLLDVPLGEKGKPSPNAPRGGVGGNYAGGGSPWVGAATPDDVVVMVDTAAQGRATWACKVNPDAADAAATEKHGVPPGTMSLASEPSAWEQGPGPESEKVREFFGGLPVNQWVPIKPPKSVSHRAWNTTAYDPDRGQFLWWGGGHVTYMGTDVAHYSVRANRWTLGYPPDLPTEPTGGFYVKAALSFQDRPQVPVHAYQAYAYDPPSGKMFYLDRAYDVAERQWEPEPYPGLKHRGAMHTLLESTPGGVVALSQHGLFRFDAAEKAWKKLPWNGPSFGDAWCDGHALCYDSRRDCLWVAHKDIFRYDLKTGAVAKLGLKPPKLLGEWALWREQVYVPDADLVLVMQLVKGADGRSTQVAFDPATSKYVTVDFDVAGAVPRWNVWTAALHYDPKFRVALVHDGSSNFWALRLDRKAAKVSELTE